MTPTQTQARQRVNVFFSALSECDERVKRLILAHIRALAKELIDLQGMNEGDAIDYAAEFFAACVWHKAKGKV